MLSISLFAQPEDLVLLDYDWAENAEPTLLTAEQEELNEVITTYTRMVEYAFTQSGLVEYNLVHRRKRLNSEDAVNSNNKVYIPVYDENKYIELKARAISGSGKVKEQDEDNIKQGFDEETEREYNYFAFEGLEVGDEIEYLYIIEKSPSYSGSAVTLQSDNLTFNTRFEVISPWNLVFQTKSYNGLPELEADTTLEEKNRLFLKVDTLKALKDEPSSYTDPNLGKVAYKLNDNLYNNKHDIISYAYAAQNIYEAYHEPLDKKERKAVKKFLKDIEEYSGTSIYRQVEDYLKTEYSIIDAYSEDLEDLAYIYKNKVMGYRGAIKLFITLYSELELENQMVYTTNRNDFRFDPDFESYLSVRECLLYLPEMDDYMDPTDQFSRIGFVNPNYRANDGLFIEAVEVGDFATAVAEVKEIEELPGSFTTDSLNLELQFTNGLDEHMINIHRSISGYNARSLQPIYEYMDEESRKDFDEAMLKYIDEEAKVEEVSLKNMEANLIGVKPMKVDGKIVLDKIIEKAGPKYLFKIGLLIGPQMELYKADDEEERKLDVEVPYGRSYERTMRFAVPEGYVVKNLDALKIDKHYNTVEDSELYFISDYVREGNDITITIREYYEKCTYPKEHFEEYRAIINAAADFNKVVLSLEKA
jgi:hypothetical protein